MTRDGSRADPGARRTAVTALALVAALVVAAAPLPLGATASASGPGPVPGPEAAAASAGGPAVAPLSLAAETEPLDNGSVDLTVTLTNTGERESSAPVVRLATVPAGWEVVDQRSANATWRSATREWLWFSVGAGESVTATARLARTDEEPGPGPVALNASDAANDTAAATAALPTTEGATPGDTATGGDGDVSDGDGGDDGSGDDTDDGPGTGAGLPVVPLALGATAVVAAGAAYVRYVRG